MLARPVSPVNPGGLKEREKGMFRFEKRDVGLAHVVTGLRQPVPDHEPS